MIFFLQKLPDTICVRKGEKTRIFVHTICFGQKSFGPKQCKPGKTIKIVVSAEIGQTKNDTFFWKKVFFLTWVKKWVLLIVFLKSCAFPKTLFYSVFSKTHFFKNKNCMMKNRKFMITSGLFLNMAKRCFLGCCFFGVLMLLWFVFVCLP